MTLPGPDPGSVGQGAGLAQGKHKVIATPEGRRSSRGFGPAPRPTAAGGAQPPTRSGPLVTPLGALRDEERQAATNQIRGSLPSAGASPAAQASRADREADVAS